MTPRDIQKASREKAKRLHATRVSRKKARRSRIGRATKFAELHRKPDLPVVDKRDIDAFGDEPHVYSSCDLIQEYLVRGVVGNGIRRTAPKPVCP